MKSFDRVIINAAGCGSTLKQYGELFAGEPGMEERAAAVRRKSRRRQRVSWPAIEPRRAARPFPGCGSPITTRAIFRTRSVSASQPRALLREIPGLELVEIPEGDQCCGSAGVYNLLQPAQRARDRQTAKWKTSFPCGPELLASANPGCTLQIQSILRERGIELEAMHPIQILDRSIAAAG